MDRSKLFRAAGLGLALMVSLWVLQPTGSEAAVVVQPNPDPNTCKAGTGTYSSGFCIGCQRCTSHPNGGFWGDDTSCPTCGLTTGGGGNN